MKRSIILVWVILAVLSAQTETRLGNVILQDVPGIPDSVIQRTRQYQNVRSASFASWDPGGEGMLIRTRFGETVQIHHVVQPMGFRQQLTFYDEPVGGGRFCPDPGRRGFLFTRDVGGSEFYQIFWFDLQRGTATLLTDGSSRNSLGPWSNSGKQFAFSSNVANGVDMNIYVRNLDEDSARVVVHKPGYWIALDWSPDDTKILVMHYVSINESTLYSVDVETGELTQIRPSEKRIGYGGAKFSRDGKGVFLTSDEDAEFKHLRYYDFETGALSPISDHIPWDVTGFDLSDDGRYLAYVTNEDGISKLRLLDLRRGRNVTIPDLPVGRIGAVRFRYDSRYLAVALNTPQTPGDITVLDIRRKRFTPWTRSEVGGLDTDRFVVPELIHVETFDGLTLPGFLYTPPSPGPHPVVVYIHGGPESQYVPYFSSTFQYWIHELGLAVLAPNVRGSSGYGKSFVLLDNGYKREDTVRDIGAFLDWIETRSDLDSERIGLYGGSYGGYMVLAGMTHYNDRIRAAVDIVGISNFVTFLTNTKPYRRDLRRQEY
ncbi:MAG: S9 family peptidase, partial [Fidelibacterota bacterium]